jgi:hypothetical protein
VSFPFVAVFLGLLLAYMVYSAWARLDARFPIGAALALLVVTAVVDAAGATAAANTLAEYVFFLLGAGVILLLVDHVREGRASDRSATPAPAGSEGEPAEATQPGKGSADQPFDRFE